MKTFPIFIVSPKVVSFFEAFSPIKIGAITLFCIVISKEELCDQVKNHERIHYHQYLELYVIGFLLLYVFFWIKNIAQGMSGSEAYMNIPFEKEAYDKQHDFKYLESREKFSWRKY
jgi:hypothetical protein